MARSPASSWIAITLALCGLAAGMSTSVQAKCLPEPAYRDDEPKALQKAKGRALRDGWVLRVMTDAGPVDFADTDCEEGPADECVKYALADVLPGHGLWVIHLGYYEDGAYELIDMRTGARTFVDGFPQFSSDGQRFATAAYSAHSDYSRLSIWKVQPNNLSKEWSYDYSVDAPAGKWNYCVERWEGTQRVVLKGEGLFTDPKRYYVRKAGRAWITFDGTSWRYERSAKFRLLPD